MAVEARRGCGYRRVGGLYLVGGGLSAPCDRMPYPLERCPCCGGGVKFTRGPQWLQPDFFPRHDSAADSVYCTDESPCPVCNNRPADEDYFGPHLLLWIGRKHYTPEAYLEESRRMGVSRRLSALPKGLVLGETWVLLAHLDAAPPSREQVVAAEVAERNAKNFGWCACAEPTRLEPRSNFCNTCDKVIWPEPLRPSPGIFCAFIPRAVELILKESDATEERREREAKRGVTVVAVPDDDRDHQGSVWDDESQPELPGVST